MGLKRPEKEIMLRYGPFKFVRNAQILAAKNFDISVVFYYTNP